MRHCPLFLSSLPSSCSQTNTQTRNDCSPSKTSTWKVSGMPVIPYLQEACFDCTLTTPSVGYQCYLPCKLVRHSCPPCLLSVIASFSVEIVALSFRHYMRRHENDKMRE